MVGGWSVAGSAVGDPTRAVLAGQLADNTKPIVIGLRNSQQLAINIVGTDEEVGGLLRGGVGECGGRDGDGASQARVVVLVVGQSGCYVLCWD